MDPVTLSVVVAALAAKVLDRAEDAAINEAGSALGRLLKAVRAKLSGGSPEDMAALAAVEAAPDSPKKIDGLAKALQRQATGDEAFLGELERLVGEVKAAGIDVESIVQSAVGDGNVQVAGVSGSNISIKTGA